MSTMKAFITKHPVLTYFAVTFALSWGGFLLVGGSGLLAGTSWQADPRFLAAVFAMLAGPPVGVLLTVLVSGKAGLRELIARLLTWRVGGRWYAVALLTATIIETTVLLVLSRISPVFLPAIVTTDVWVANSQVATLHARRSNAVTRPSASDTAVLRNNDARCFFDVMRPRGSDGIHGVARSAPVS